MGLIKSFATGYVVGSALLDPRRFSRRILSAIGFVIYTAFLFAAFANKSIGMGGVLFSVVLFGFLDLVCVSKFATLQPLSIFKWPSYAIASFSRDAVAKYWIIAMAAIGVIAIAMSGKSSWYVFAALFLVAVIGTGVQVTKMPNKDLQQVYGLQAAVAQMFGAAPDSVDIANTGTFAKPQYSCRFPVVVSAEDQASFAHNFEQLVQGFSVASCTSTGAVFVPSIPQTADDATQPSTH
ncbi:hypothetical protein [Bifidobacterium tibiigranuli]|jgi:hypothetical protein|uniref:hypothetical protein n=1 Tax=Bifidobacterium tibiigranuli TaxID=2172043 RepID=UPI0026F04D8B|nr:hypothetical protein [Bifidobacterium tibiigranuli]MCI1649437.1 hypothetical protein [Bifidobacterium tibiigranuli]MCI2186201.1 hypothetical protein [Bifidobacterium tibiigranuli]MCI2203972.1 hypothetical protein [Bifidobacterium tibiigranuli]